MISQKMKPFVENGSAIRAMFEEGLRMQQEVGAEHVFDFSIGNPNVPAPEGVEESIRHLVDTEDPVRLHGYMPNAGFADVREAVAENLNRRFGTSFSGKNLLMTVGAASAMNALLKSILDPGDEVVVIAPYFMEYASYVRNYDGVLKEVAACPESFLPDLCGLENAITQRTKAVIINSPNNPTGVIYGEDVLRGLSRVLTEAEERFHTEILLISDEPYRELSYDGCAVPFVTKFYPNTAVCYSFSKSLSLPGERIGYLLIPDEVSGASELMNAAVVAHRIIGCVNAPSLIQLAVAENLDADISGTIQAYDENRRLLYQGLKKLGFSCVYPSGAFYLWMKAPMEEADFVALCKKHYVLVVPGSSFHGTGYVRIAYCVSKKKIEDSFQAWEKIAEEAFAAQQQKQ